MVKLEKLSAFEVGKRHKEIIPMLESAIEHADGEYTVSDIIDYISRGEQGCLGVFDGMELIGVFTVMLITYPRRSVIRLVTMGGLAVDRWSEVEPALIQFVKDNGCQAIECWCRDGAAKVAVKSFKADHHYNVVIREVL